MKNLRLILGFALLSAMVVSCKEDNDDDNITEVETGSFEIEFDNYVGSTDLVLSAETDTTNYKYTTTNSQSFNVSSIGYYITQIKLEGPNGEEFIDPINVSASASEVTGFYHIKESDENSLKIELDKVPAGKYDKITFTLGIPEAVVIEGASGGVLDPAAGAWFWNWNAGYIGFSMEGTSSSVIGSGRVFQFHIGGWKDVESTNFVNNVKTFTLDFPSYVNVSKSLTPEAHIVCDLKKVLDDALIDFSVTKMIHSPKAGMGMADVLPNVFVVEHVHQ